MFKAHVEKKWNTGEVEVYLVERNHISSGQTYFEVKDGQLWGTTVSEGAPIDAMLRLPLEALEALGLALANVLPPSAATAVHLEDTRAVRDRLLAIVENLTVRP